LPASGSVKETGTPLVEQDHAPILRGYSQAPKI
jgi:hypothetical protein